MTHRAFSEDVQALMAGYVLGDLDSEERQQFQQLLKDHPELAQEISTLKETLSLLPYGLPSERPASDVRSRLLVKAQQQLEAEPAVSRISDHQKKRARSPSPLKTRLIAAMAMILGGFSLVLAHRVSTLQTRLAAANQVVELAMTSNPSSDESSAVTIYQADGLLTEQWSGLTQIIQDHVGSLERSQGPVDIATADPLVIQKELRDQLQASASLNEPVPTLSFPKAQLLGGSPCQFSQANGLRMTYTLPSHGLVSLYQIDMQGNQFPTFTGTYITTTQDNVNLVLWRQDDYLYALAAEIPPSHLRLFTEVMELI